MDRALASEAEGCWFDPSQSHHFPQDDFLIYRRAVSLRLYGDVLVVSCGFAFQCAVTVGATVLALDKRPISASLRSLGVYIYAFGSQSCATRLVFEGSARQGPDRDRAWHPREFGAVLGGLASLPLPVPPLPSSSRRYAPQCFVAGIPASRLATCLTAHPTNRVGACRSVRHSPPRPLPHLP